MKFLRFMWKLFVMASVFGVGYIVGREHSFEEEEQWEAENRKNNENNDKPECESCSEKTCDSCKEKPVEEKAECGTCTEKNCEECKEAEDEKKSLNSVTFEYENEKATKVALVGNFNNWNKDSDVMTKENNTWKITKELEAGTYEYQYVVDDTDWVVDPKTETTKNKYEGLNSVIVVK